MPRKGDNIYKRKDGRWEGRYIKSHKPDRSPQFGYVYAASYSEVKSKLIDLKASIKPKAVADQKPISGEQYGTILTAWLNDAKYKTKESTYSHYLHSVNTHIRPRLGKLPLDQFSTENFDRFIEELLYSGRVDNTGGLSAKSVSDIAAIVRSTLRYAENHGYVCPRTIKRLCLKKHSTKMRVLSKGEQQKVMKVLLNETDRYKLAVLISLYMGLRIGEVCALQWKDIDVDVGMLHVRSTLQRIQDSGHEAGHKTRVIVSSPKSDCSIRDIPIPECIKPIIKDFSGSPNEYVISESGKAFVEPRLLQYHFSKIIKEAAIEKANYHALRHTFATRYVEAGFEIKSLSEILGHANVNITLNKYVHASVELKEKNMNLMAMNAMMKSPQ